MVPQILWIVLMSFSLLLNAYQHGKPKEGFNSFWVALISGAIHTGLLLWGGFFSVFVK